MFQTMEGNARSHRVSEIGAQAEQSQADLMRSLQAVSDNIMRLAGKLHADSDSGNRAEDSASIHQQNAIAQDLIARLLAIPASQV
ncbi:hypothetical protein BRCH_03981 [Candidatus Burkholderia brachyanthoides]|nr:hypothetical protein BRCH_03981 [Candidatus Burkholderia brachyanthoides]